jgi:ATP-dependent exoDNAse (exonuclease V) alpha subunit
VHRQRDAWDREALGHLRSGELEHWAAAYLEHDRIHVHDTADLARRQLIADWAKHAADGEAQLILAHRRQDVRELNTLARARLREEGRLGPDHHFGDRAFAVGDTVVATTNRRHAGLVNGQRLTVVAADDRALHLQPVGQDKQEIVLAHFSITDSDIDHGYAMTVHRAQGATVDRVLVLADDGLDRNLAYTALSRHRVEAHLHTTHDALTGDTGQPTDDPAQALANLVRRSSPKELAHQPHELEIFQRDAALDLGLGAGRDDGLDLGW